MRFLYYISPTLRYMYLNACLSGYSCTLPGRTALTDASSWFHTSLVFVIRHWQPTDTIWTFDIRHSPLTIGRTYERSVCISSTYIIDILVNLRHSSKTTWFWQLFWDSRFVLSSVSCAPAEYSELNLETAVLRLLNLHLVLRSTY